MEEGRSHLSSHGNHFSRRQSACWCHGTRSSSWRRSYCWCRATRCTNPTPPCVGSYTTTTCCDPSYCRHGNTHSWGRVQIRVPSYRSHRYILCYLFVLGLNDSGHLVFVLSDSLSVITKYLSVLIFNLYNICDHYKM